ncbi:unnamed protein product [Notodromas monacha]|uniref:Uncharacterized protein n=1 Tax=Notodromas monacha TaxID=399045 RepID=A0A7R9BR17_9CRUS|nr:unnamed protein product [Notodromas monacha]CAG0920117.1 unnamed protein product [Notodromas monacha]
MTGLVLSTEHQHGDNPESTDTCANTHPQHPPTRFDSMPFKTIVAVFDKLPLHDALAFINAFPAHNVTWSSSPQLWENIIISNACIENLRAEQFFAVISQHVKHVTVRAPQGKFIPGKLEFFLDAMFRHKTREGFSVHIESNRASAGVRKYLTLKAPPCWVASCRRRPLSLPSPAWKLGTLKLKHRHVDFKTWARLTPLINTLFARDSVLHRVHFWRDFSSLRVLDLSRCAAERESVARGIYSMYCSAGYPRNLEYFYAEECENDVLMALGVFYPIKCYFHEYVCGGSPWLLEENEKPLELPVPHQIFRKTNTVSVAGCRGFDDECCTLLAEEYAPNLRHVNFSGSGISPHRAEQFRTERPNVDVIYGAFPVRSPRTSGKII